MAGSADFKSDLNKTQMFDPRLCKFYFFKVLETRVKGVVDICYGGENGLNEAM